jgi:hypothetical protein
MAAELRLPAWVVVVRLVDERGTSSTWRYPASGEDQAALPNEANVA